MRHYSIKWRTYNWILDQILLIDLRLTNNCPELFSVTEKMSLSFEERPLTSHLVENQLKLGKDLATFNFHQSFRMFSWPNSCSVTDFKSAAGIIMTVLSYSHRQLMLYSDFSVSRQMRIVDISWNYCIAIIRPRSRSPTTFKNFHCRCIAPHHEKRTFNSSNTSTSTYTWGTI